MKRRGMAWVSSFDRLRARVARRPPGGEQLPATRLGKIEHLPLLAAERPLFAGALNFNKPAFAAEDEIGIDLGAAVPS